MITTNCNFINYTCLNKAKSAIIRDVLPANVNSQCNNDGSTMRVFGQDWRCTDNQNYIASVSATASNSADLSPNTLIAINDTVYMFYFFMIILLVCLGFWFGQWVYRR